MSQYLKERLIGGNRRHRLFSYVACLGRRHLGLGGVLMSVTRVIVRSFHLVRVIIDRNRGLVFAVDEGKRQICHIFVVCAAMLMEHSKPIKGILCFLSISRVLYQVFYQADVVLGFLKFLTE